jgi:peptidoglycan/xylan/chitin deacetylase (PgdA/CDA1 family)
VATALLSRLFARHVGDQGAHSRGLYLSAAMIREMAQGGMAFGGHTEHHFVLSRLDAAAQRAELRAGLEQVRALTGQASVPFCYPYGHPHTYDAATLAALADLGYSTAFTTAREVERGQHGRYEIARFDTNDLYPHVNGVAVAAAAAERA